MHPTAPKLAPYDGKNKKQARSKHLREPTLLQLGLQSLPLFSQGPVLGAPNFPQAHSLDSPKAATDLHCYPCEFHLPRPSLKAAKCEEPSAACAPGKRSHDQAMLTRASAAMRCSAWQSSLSLAGPKHAVALALMNIVCLKRFERSKEGLKI